MFHFVLPASRRGGMSPAPVFIPSSQLPTLERSNTLARRLPEGFHPACTWLAAIAQLDYRESSQRFAPEETHPDARRDILSIPGTELTHPQGRESLP